MDVPAMFVYAFSGILGLKGIWMVNTEKMVDDLGLIKKENVKWIGRSMNSAANKARGLKT